MGVMESEHRLATRLYQNTARVHFNDHTEKQGRLGACIVYGGVVMSLARALSFNGLGNAPAPAGDQRRQPRQPVPRRRHGLRLVGGAGRRPTLPGRTDVGALRLRLVATKDRPVPRLPAARTRRASYLPEILLDLDYWVLVPRRAVAV